MISVLPRRIGLFIALACLLPFGLEGWREWVARTQQINETTTALGNLASSLTQHAEDTVELADTALIGIAERLKIAGADPAGLAAVSGLLVMRAAMLPRVLEFSVYGLDGSWIAGSMAHGGSNNGDRDYFRSLLNEAAPEPFVGSVIRSRSTGRWTINVSRRFRHPDGSLAGVVVAVIEMAYFVAQYSAYDLGPDSTIALMSRDGQLLARYPSEEPFIPRDYAQAPLFQLVREQVAGSAELSAVSDGLPRLYSYRRSTRYPLVVAVAMAMSYALRDWRVDAIIHLAIAMVLTVAAGWLGLRLARQVWRRQAEALVRESESRYRLLADSTTDVITCLDLNLRRTYASPSCRTVFGREPQDMIGETPADGMHPDDVATAYRSIRRLAAGSIERERAIYRVRHAEGHFVWIEIDMALIRDESGQPAAIAGSTRDITDRKVQADALSLANAQLETLARHLARARDAAERANRAKSRFLASMSHELRTPLNGVLGYAQLLRLDGGLNALQSGRVDAMLGAGSHLLQMINGVLDFSQIEAERLELQAADIDLPSLVSACIDLVRPAADAKALVLALCLAPDLPGHFVADATRLRQILLNLLGNAVKFTASGSVEVRLGRVRHGGGVTGPGLRIEVADTGPGLSPEHQARLFRDFERFDGDARSPVEGAGLGLALSSRLAALMGGQLGRDDNPAGGSVFWLELPQDSGAAAPGHHGAAPRNELAATLQGAPKLRVLLADDVAMNRDIASAFLHAAGHDIVCVAGGAEAVAMAADSDFDAVLMDVRMPGMDGLEAAHRIRALPGPRGSVPIVALTAQAFAGQIEETQRAGMDDHLAKPFQLEALEAVLRKAVAGRPAAAGAAAAAGPVLPEHGLDLPVFNVEAFQRTAAYLSPAALASYLRTVTARCEALRKGLEDLEPETSQELGAAAHILAGSAGMFGFDRLTVLAGRFEHAIQTRSGETSGLAASLGAALDASLHELHGRVLMAAAM